MSSRVVHFEIHAADPERAMKFYQAAFGWDFPKWMEEPPYWGVMTAPAESKEPGINGGLLVRRGAAPAEGAAVNAYVCTVQVDSYDETHDRIMKAGGTPPSNFAAVAPSVSSTSASCAVRPAMTCS